MHGVQRVGLVVVSPLVVAHVNRDRRVEGGEDVVRGCESRKVQKESELDEWGRERRLQKKELDFQKKKGGISKAKGGYNKATGISEQAEHFRVTYWHYHTGEVE